jgi:hypothetical protein
MIYRYYLGVFNKDTNLFNKNISRDNWEKFKLNMTKISEDSQLRYYTMDRCFIRNKTNGKVYTEKYPSTRLNSQNELLVEVESNTLPFFPTQYSYFNKQTVSIAEYRNSFGNTITFSNYKENGIDYYEIYSSSSISSSSL